MREIKFRGKNSKDEWVYGSLIINETENEKGKFQVAFIAPGLPCASDGGDFYTARMVRVKIETIGQYTGLKDKNGKEIYEGDKLKVNGKRIFRIAYQSSSIYICAYVLLYMDGAFADYLKWGLNEMYEVVGNVFDKNNH